MVQPQLIYADSDIAVVAKPAGMVVHPGSGHRSDHLLGWLQAQLASDGPDKGLAPGHRIDKLTSGLVLFGRHKEALAKIEETFKKGAVDKVYLTLAQGVTHRKGKITQPLNRREGEGVLPAETRFRRVRYCRAATLLRVTPVTGRPHQIRRHLRAVGHPIAGDERWGLAGFNRYMAKAHGLRRLFLHAAGLSLPHPITQEDLLFVDPLPEALLDVLASLELAPPPFPWGPEGEGELQEDEGDFDD